MQQNNFVKTANKTVNFIRSFVILRSFVHSFVCLSYICVLNLIKINKINIHKHLSILSLYLNKSFLNLPPSIRVKSDVKLAPPMKLSPAPVVAEATVRALTRRIMDAQLR